MKRKFIALLSVFYLMLSALCSCGAVRPANSPEDGTGNPSSEDGTDSTPRTVFFTNSDPDDEFMTSEEAAIAAADLVLEKIVESSMTPREKAKEIYDWASDRITYSNSTSYLMGDFYQSAFSGLTYRRGNCYTYFAVTSLLLTRAGVENIEIQRNDPAKPHYWNLVKIDGKWYHLDTCPHFAGHQKEVFLWTDSQVAEYSQYEVSGYYSFDPSLYPISN